MSVAHVVVGVGFGGGMAALAYGSLFGYKRLVFGGIAGIIVATLLLT